MSLCPECGHEPHLAGLCNEDLRPACNCNADEDDEPEVDESFSCPGCGNLMDDQAMFDEHEGICPDLNEEDE